MSHKYPFSAIVGMGLAKKSLLLHAVNPRLGGVLIRGHRGCAKTTLARAFGGLLEDSPCVELPLGATEDRLLGSVDVAGVLEKNKWAHQPGLLEKANGGVLYVDEVNLLSDALSDQLLDAAATGGYKLEREGVSRSIATRFILIGSMNPEEGELRPQLSDRFAHSVEVSSDLSSSERAQVMRQQIEFENGPETFIANFADQEAELVRKIEAARQILGEVKLSDQDLEAIAMKTEELQLEGMRGGLAVARTASASAAWEGRTQVADEDLDLAWELCIGHRSEDPPERNKDQDAGQSPPSNGGGRSFTSLQPKGAREPIVDDQSQAEENEDLAKWMMQKADQVEARDQIEEGDNASINWRQTILGWVGRSGERVIKRQKRVRRRRTWIFVDASRSSGGNNFLGKSLSILRPLLGAISTGSERFEILLLEGGKLRWRGRRLLADRATKELQGANTASGQSDLLPAMSKLMRDISRKPGNSTDRVLFFSDGICTVEPRRSVETTWNQMARTLMRIVRMGPSVLWVAPKPKRGFQHPVESMGLSESVKAISI